MLGSLTKVLACPGLRIGYVVVPDDGGAGLGVPGLMERLARRQPAWSVGPLALAALPELLASADLSKWARALTVARQELLTVLGAHGLTPLASDANFVLVPGVPGLRVALAHQGVVVRDCAVVRPARSRAHCRPRRHRAGPARRRVDAVRPPKTGPGGAMSEGGLRGAVMVCGTASNSGKSLLVAGLCRLLARRGVLVAPFKGQNMSLNSVVTDDGAEIGRAQAAQAEAAGTPPEAAMNPVLLKPMGERRSQVVVMGKPWRVLDAADYQATKPELRGIVLDALADLRRRFEVVVLEGAGSPAEINLMEGDLVNLGLAERAGIGAVVVGDIDRGGVFAHLFGTVELLPADLRRRVRGFIINKLRGDPALLGSGPRELEARTGVPTLGVIPWLDGVWIDAEDSLALSAAPGWRDRPGHPAPDDAIDVAVLRFPRVSNFTDIDALAAEPGVSIRWVEQAAQLADPDLVVLPGTKSTVGDLGWLRSRHLDRALAGLLRSPHAPGGARDLRRLPDARAPHRRRHRGGIDLGGHRGDRAARCRDHLRPREAHGAPAWPGGGDRDRGGRL